MPVYELEKGVLSILSMQPSQSIEQRQALETLVSALVQFSLLLGGFGKSWRRVDHRLFYPSYLAKGSKPMIGCHWEFIEGSRTLYHPVNKIENISAFLDSLSQIIRAWITHRNESISQRTENWREAWHKAQVWGRFAADSKDSHAVKWFHGDYFASKSIYQSALTGQMGKIGRIWHRMYLVSSAKRVQ